jgi:HJR/Mrr/RecB family endonuclease
MMNFLKKLGFTSKDTRKSSDFSDFFTSSAGEKKKVITQVLREANEEQRKMVGLYQKKLTKV